MARNGDGSADGGIDPMWGWRLLVGVVHCWALTLQTVTRMPGSCGHRYFGLPAWLGWGWFMLWVEFGQPTKGRDVLLVVWYALPALFVVHRLASLARRRRGHATHSLFVGKSWFQVLLPFAPADLCRGPLEWLTLMVAGAACYEPCPALGGYLMVGSFANLGSLALLAARDERRIEQMEDATHEARALAELLRERRRDV